jgi:hypothetical protein
MNNSIQHFCEEGIKKLDNIIADFFEHPENMAEFVEGIRDELLRLGCDIIGETYDELDEMIRNSPLRKEKWEIVRRDRKGLLTSIGEVSFQKTLFKDKKSGQRTYLLDHYLGLEENVQMTEDAEARVLEEAVQTSYRKAGEAASILDSVSKGTVKNRLHALQFPKEEYQGEKKRIRYLYIDADEDHVPLQFLTEKGDVVRDQNGRKNNNTQVKLVYVYEGIERVSPGGKRYRLINPHYFSGIYEGKENENLWSEVEAYIGQRYDLDNVERIYLNADGGSWIKGHRKKLTNVTEVLDEYHINKYLTSMTSHLYDSIEDGKEQLRESMREGTPDDFREVVSRILRSAEESDVARIKEGEAFLLRNWAAVKVRMSRADGVVGSSTEAHVSHVLSFRMSSRPMGWSKRGADCMGKLRVYHWNKGNMLDLVRFQKAERRKENGDRRILPGEILRSCEKEFATDGRYFDSIQRSIPAKTRKILAIRDHLMA